MNYGTAQLVQEILRGPKPSLGDVGMGGGALLQRPMPDMTQAAGAVGSGGAALMQRGQVAPQPPAAQPPSAAPQAEPSPYIDPNQIPQLAEAMVAKTNAPAPAPAAPNIAQQIYPERFAGNDDQRLSEIQGRISADSRAQKMMRMAEMNGQTLPFALAHQMASSSFPTTSAQTAGMPSLPQLDPARIAGYGPAAGGVAGQTQIGMGMNENVSGKNQMDFYNEQGRQGIARSGQGDQNQMLMMELLRRLNSDQHTQRNENRVLDDTLGNPQRQSQQAAGAWLGSDAGKAAQTSTDPMTRQMYEQKVREFMGTGRGASSTQQPPPATSQTDLIKQREAALVASPAAMQQHLAQFADPLARQREEARLYMDHGQGTNPAVGTYLRDITQREDPNLLTGPDWLSSPEAGGVLGGVMSGGNPFITALTAAMFGSRDRPQAAADWAKQRHGIDPSVSLPHFQQIYQ